MGGVYVLAGGGVLLATRPKTVPAPPEGIAGSPAALVEAFLVGLDAGRQSRTGRGQ